MSRSGPSGTDLAVLRDVLDLADVHRHAPSSTVVSEILRRLERTLGCDGLEFHVMDARDFTYRYVQEVDSGRATVSPSPENVHWDGEEIVHEWWWRLPCSLVERRNQPGVQSVRSFYGQRRWAEHPAQREFFQAADILSFGYPLGNGRSARVVGPRFDGPIFGDRELTICRLLLASLRDVLLTVGASSGRETPVLTERQAEIVQLVAAGLSNRDIAGALGISVGTVRTHLDQIYARLDVSSRTAAVAAVAGPASVTPSR
ncbi:helix-turn-helix transcriptional regulator [Isoptericola haloaureus]|uniref:Helix-turn-helix transcriptional regulator n=1 Tax=Isoptericola haloaureus TaxID=1542902 RepID=A0ABU7Z7F8_9MICO